MFLSDTFLGTYHDFDPSYPFYFHFGANSLVHHESGLKHGNFFVSGQGHDFPVDLHAAILINLVQVVWKVSILFSNITERFFLTLYFLRSLTTCRWKSIA